MGMREQPQPVGVTEQPQPEGGAGDAQAQAMQSMKTIEDALLALGQAVQEAGAPPEALNALSQATKSYGEFLSIVTGSVEAQEGPAQAQTEVAGARGRVRPAEEPTGAQPVPA